LPAAAPASDAIRIEALRTLVRLGDGQMATVRESPVQVPTGTGVSMFAMLAQPDRAARAKGGPAVLMLNPGAVHHIGPNRLWVRLARQWAARGITVLRLDLSGVGDSPARPGATENTVYSEHALQDVAAALDYLRTELGAGECHLVGLCSGAYHALKATIAGQPVASAIIINPLVYFWKEGTPLDTVHDYALSDLAARYRGKFFTREPWLKLLRGQLHVRLVAQVLARWVWRHVASRGIELARWLKIPLRDDLAGELQGAAWCALALRVRGQLAGL
jgi:pimeloyl-ACP methyl ester carboxylesterase